MSTRATLYLNAFHAHSFRLRVGEVRVFYDVTEAVVEILAIVPKSQAATWLEQAGEADEGNSPF